MLPNIADHPQLSALFHYWNDKRQGRNMPDRADIDPIEMGGRWLPHLVLSDLRDRATRVRFRLVGTNVVKRFGFDPTGQHMDELSGGAYFDALAASHLRSFIERVPVYSESRFEWGVNHRLDLCHLLLPLTNGGALPGMVLMGLVFRSLDSFPPQLRQLCRHARHVERCHAVLAPDAAGIDLLARLDVA